ncbi:5'-3' exoribonuclease 1 [Parasteatoda tepidariorum]|uniref:5'-3' exoribonuclease 1 n=1 Tax=Parasteatoda tepidariorum TaxID=114398 RepID=UPI00077F9CF1|nr:5'-3' exoribonuclease 1 [Parasteatoda tepidariorum]XP_015922999.1 5'-3' exoribonuclease 1 [Parasteatoda tepidariorum]
MGVPKFYRWISERYPCLSEVVTEFQIPDFDNLYLDMNGIIHTCSHPNDDDPHFRITEEKIFANICHYIEFLFKMIKPKKVFFMAVDGVAPRAKMNQQRGRRFRTAKTALMLEEQALASGESLPQDAKFDSNCITPGTPFMVRLNTILKEFAVYKISTDKLWQDVRVYLSGHETPGEGEHKIMDFIRYEKSQPKYNPNTRHCLYGLDADLIMLGLCSHEPHFCLLREEVKFGKKNQKKIATAEETTFHLLHISLLRDYFYHEFSPVKDKLPFPYDVEKIIDDFVLMSFLVGNDFIPHLPQLHIHHDALPVLFKTYMDALPMLGGYINEGGFLNLERFEMFFEKLAEYDFQKFGELNEDFQYLEKKSKCQNIEEDDKTSTSDILSGLGFSNLAIAKTAEYDSSSEDEDSEEECSTLELEFNMHKVDYYMNKLELEKVTDDVMKDQAEGYVRAIQWNLHYYYNGVVSWSWYYPHHYSPYISDVKDFKNMEMNFELGHPFLPFQQLLSVLPKLSKDLLPESYQKLMCDKDSPLIDFYPDDFLTDLNGKQQEWEAIVLIPFINEKLLLKFAAEADKNLTEEERLRNRHGPHLLYTYNSKITGGPLSFLPGHYSPISETHAEVRGIEPDYFRLPSELIYKGLCQDVVLDRFILGFPTLKTLKHSACLKNEKVKVFHMVSMKDNMMITIQESVEEEMIKLSEKLMGKIIYVGWPHLQEALVVSLSDGKVKYCFDKDWRSNEKMIVSKDMTKDEQKIWVRQVENVEEQSYQRWGIFTQKINVLVFVKKFSGVKYIVKNDGRIAEDKQFEGSLIYCAAQTVVSDIIPFNPDSKTEKSIVDIFPINSVVFLLTSQYYGSAGKINDNDVIKNKGCVLVDIELTTEPNLLPVIHNQEALMEEQFMPGYIAAQQLGIESHFFSCITGVIMIQTSPKGSSCPNRVNVGLNLKFNKKNEEVQGFSKKKDNQWLYSEEVVKTLNNYLCKFADFFEKLYNFMDNDVIYVEDLYPNGEGSEIMKEITTWLKEQACSLADRQQCGMNKLDVGIICAVEKTVLNSTKDEIYHVKKVLKPDQLFNPLLNKGVYKPDHKCSFHLFDRVVNIRPSSSVPLGLKGTIIGIQKAEKESDDMYEILFDKEFLGGIAIGSGTKKGYRMPADALINISHGLRLQKQNNNSPIKTTRVLTPKLKRTSVFDSAVKQLHPNPPLVQVLQKLNSSVPNQAKPFYKADNNDSFVGINQSFNPLPSSLTFYNSSNKQFVTPNANRLSSGSSGSPSRQDSATGSHSDFQNFWLNLKKRAPDSPTNPELTKQSPKQHPQQTNSVSEQTYGQKVSVEELFQGVQHNMKQSQNQIKNNNSFPKSPTSHPKAEAPDLLRQLCLDIYKKPPIYNYQSHGITNFHTATIKLPNNEHVSSIPCATKLEAAANAAETGLAFLRTSLNHNVFPPDPSIYRQIPPPNFVADPRPYFSPLRQTSSNLFPPPPTNLIPPPPSGNFIPPVNFRPAAPTYPPSNYQPFPQRFDTTLMRHGQPYQSQIPESFLKVNQRLLLPSETVSAVQQNNVGPLPSFDNNASVSQGDVFHLPGGGTAIVRNSTVQQWSPRGKDNPPSNMFVPAQVMKYAIKAEGPLSSSEWPDLPAKETKKSLTIVSSPDSQASDKRTSKSFSEISKCLSHGDSSAESCENSVPSNSSMTVLKKTKPRRRIAANFQNA